MNINFEYYKVFYIIAKNKNITKAAQELNISQPAISRMLKTMEEQMNTTLFIRKNKGVILTTEGKELYRLIADNINNIIKSEISFSKIINSKTIRIASNKTYINYLIKNNRLDKILNKDISINIIDIDNFESLNSQLSNNVIDFAFIAEPTNYQFSDKLIFKELDTFNLVFVSNSKSKSNNVITLNNRRFNEIYKKFLGDNNINSDAIIQVDDYDNICSLVINGYGKGFLFKEYIGSNIENNTILNISDNITSIKFGILYNINNELKIKKYFNI